MRNASLALLFLALLSGCRSEHTAGATGELTVVAFGPGGAIGQSRNAVLDFGDIYFGHPAPAHLEVLNTGRASISLSSLEVVSGDVGVSADGAASVHAFDARFTPTTIEPGASARFPLVVSRPGGSQDMEELSAELKLTATGTVMGEETAAIHLRARAVRDGCTVPASVEFGVVGVDDTAQAALSFPNLTRHSRLAPAPVLESETGDHLAFQVESAPSETSGGASREVLLSFHPTESRDYTAQLRLKGFDDCEERVVELHGKGASELVLWDTKTSFGFVPVGLSRTVSVTLKNIGPKDATLSHFSFKDDPSFSFAGEPPESAVVPAGGETTLDLSCSPDSIGPHEGAFDFDTDLRQQPAGRIVLTCMGGGADIEVQPEGLLNFGKVAFVASATTPLFQTRRLTILNVGTTVSAPPDPAEALHLGKDGAPPYFEILPAAGTNVGEFEVSLDAAYDPAKGLRAYAAKNLLPVLVKLTPASTGQKEADLVIYSDDLDEPAVTVHLSANAVEYPPCRYSLQPASIDFGRLGTYEERDLEFKLRNLGQLPDEKCLVSALDLTPGSDAAFSLPDGAIGSRELLPGEELTVRVHAAPVGTLPGSPKTVSGNIQFFINSPSTPEVTVPVTMEIGASCLAMFPDHLDFGSVAVGCSRTKTLQLRNMCGGDLYITGASFRAGSSDFTLISAPSIPSTGLVVRPGVDHPEFQVRVSPQALGKEQATFGIDVKQTSLASSVPNLVEMQVTGATSQVQTDGFTQGGDPVDILFNETNEDYYFLSNAARVAQRMPVFLQYLLDAQVDFHFGVTAFDTWFYCDVTTKPGSACNIYFSPGSLYFAPDHPELYLTATTPDLTQKAQAKVGLWCGGIGHSRAGVHESIAAVTPPNATGPNAGFLRPAARLAIVQFAFLRDVDGLTTPLESAANQYSQLITVKGAQRKSDVVFSGFCAQENTTDPAFSIDWDDIAAHDPVGVPYRPFWRYRWLAQATGGMFGNSNEHNYLVSETEDLAQTVSGFRKWFPLSVAPDLTAGPVTVTVNGASWPQTNAQGDPVWSYDASTNRVVFASVLSAPPKGATVDISYPTACQ